MFSLENPAGGRNDITFEEYRRQKMRMRYEKGDMNNVLENMKSTPRPPQGKVEIVRTVVTGTPTVRTLNYQMGSPTEDGAVVVQEGDYEDGEALLSSTPPPPPPGFRRDTTGPTGRPKLPSLPSAGEEDDNYYDVPYSPPTMSAQASGIYEDFDDGFVQTLSGGIEEMTIPKATDCHLYAVVNKNRRESAASLQSNQFDAGAEGAAGYSGNFHQATPVGAYPERVSPPLPPDSQWGCPSPPTPDEILYESVDFGSRRASNASNTYGDGASPAPVGDKKYEFNGKKFHDGCFTCAICKQAIGNNSFVPRERDELVCMPCYEQKLAQKCGRCSKILNKGGVTFRKSAYHKECFLCTTCGCELANTKFATKDEQPYCPDCYVKAFAKLCQVCSKPIAGLGEATKYVAFEGKQWHADCFACTKCAKSLLGQGFLVQNDEVLCPDCGN